MRRTITAIVAVAGILSGTEVCAETITVATVNNADMIIMQRLSPQWEQRTGNRINWVVLEENVLRQRATTDIATRGGQFDVLTIGSYEAPIWAKQNWLTPLDDFPKGYDYEDIFPTVREALSGDGRLVAVPFYAESSFTMYRRDLFEQAGLQMPQQPSYDDIEGFARTLTKRDQQQYGICLRGKPGWGENTAYFSTLVNTFGGRWFDEKWNAELDTKPWQDAAGFYVHLLRDYGPPGASSNGFNENLALFATGHCAIWIDATVAAGFVTNRKGSQVADRVGFAQAPVARVPNGSHWFWAWALAVPKTSKKPDTAKSFLAWATSKDYIAQVGKSEGWASVPPGTRKSTYDNPEYVKAASFATLVNQAIQTADLRHPSAQPVPYVGIQYVAIPEFQAIGTTVGQALAGALTGQSSVEDALKGAQASVTATMQQAGYQ
ncbi:Various polyols ABC transporter, periplasmic substrate-binding protein [Rhodovastum atsumiense]|uniref:Sugar ABC transporter substrate-binding protein n=1 Tax=Rhodovastum atsumiense TaxID=504468 RepID=A0A5M6IRA9_9PROT|nr:sugar ABC transporter substrate-binding protein [Rhodovastum atsumiense]KAA5610088.1 sugar ABC transporter substrate-binding protein [Rhodovastum atsumiense]CAH2601441.1 Various polyols ABC transporter, periplasmic substrate-binding protein [Rhodovastum atsumiense]